MTRSMLLAAARVLFVGALHAQALPDNVTVSAEIIGSCVLGSLEDSPLAAESSPSDDRKVLVVLGIGGCMANLASGSLLRSPSPDQPVTWTAGGILWREADGRFGIVDAESFKPARSIAVEHVELPRWYAPSMALDVAVDLPSGAGVNVPSTAPRVPHADWVRVVADKDCISWPCAGHDDQRWVVHDGIPSFVRPLRVGLRRVAPAVGGCPEAVHLSHPRA